MPNWRECSQPKNSVVTGGRVWLRPPHLADVEEFLTLVNESRSFHGPWVSSPGTPDAFADYVARADGVFAPFLLCAAPAGRIVGAINVSNICYGNFCSACVGYWIAVGDQGKGLMTEGMALLLDHAFSTMHLHRIEANVQPGNAQSKKLLTRLGFRLEGYSPRFLRINGAWKDHERWAICADDVAMKEKRAAGP
jgi:[ribosomal protein S5]-alanine N-acetyltransferase